MTEHASVQVQQSLHEGIKFVLDVELRSGNRVRAARTPNVAAFGAQPETRFRRRNVAEQPNICR